MSLGRQLSGCENKKHGCRSFNVPVKMQYFEIGIALFNYFTLFRVRLGCNLTRQLGLVQNSQKVII